MSRKSFLVNEKLGINMEVESMREAMVISKETKHRLRWGVGDWEFFSLSTQEQDHNLTLQDLRDRRARRWEARQRGRRKYRQDHKEEIAEKHKKYDQDHKEEIKEYKKKYYQEHRERYLERQKKHNQDHKEEIKEYMKRYRQDHKDKK